MAAQPLE